MFCKHCGREISSDATFCPNCGERLADNQTQTQTQIVQEQSGGSAVGWGFLSWFFPIVGLILFLCWRDTRPKVSKVCGICALVSFIVNIVTSILAWTLLWDFILSILNFYLPVV